MKISTLFSIGLLTAFFVVVPAHAQNPTARPTTPRPAIAPAPANPVTPAGISTAIQNAERSQSSDTLLMLYGQSVTSPDLSRAAISQLLSSYYTRRNQAVTADQAVQAVSEAMLRFSVLQAAQNQTLIQQNQQILQQNERIITLLEIQSLPPAKSTTPAVRR
jgi:hypothetical protein